MLISALVVLLFMVACGNRGAKNMSFDEPDDYDGDSMQSTYEKFDGAHSGPKIYSNSSDGFTNIRQSPSSKSPIIGVLRNGNDFLYQAGDEGKWLAVHYNGTIGYVFKSIVSSYPSDPVYVDVDTKWLQGAWTSSGGQIYYFVYSNGKYAQVYQYGRVCYGKYKLEGYDIVFTPTVIFDGEYGDLSRGEERLAVNLSPRRLGNLKKKQLPREEEVYGGEITIEYFFEIRKDVNRRVR